MPAGNRMRFIDTSIIFYAFDRTQGRKREQVKDFFKKISIGEIEGCVSNKVLSELYNAVTIKVKEKKETAFTIIAGVLESDSWKKINYAADTVVAVAQFSERFEVPFWDALAQTMLENRVREIVSEDEIFSKILGIRALNPFR